LHRSLNAQSFISHPNIAKFIDLIKKEEERSHFKILQRMSGKLEFDVKSLLQEEKLKTLVCNFKFFNIEEFFNILDGIAKWKVGD
jgi:hypothetical protein